MPYMGYTLPAGTTLHRVQRSVPLATTVTIGPARLPPSASLLGRFELSRADCAAFALNDLTAIYETQARREAKGVSLAALAQLELLTATTTAALQLADLRPHTTPRPLLIAMGKLYSL